MSFLDTLASIITILPLLAVFANFPSPYREFFGGLSIFFFILLLVLLQMRGLIFHGDFRLAGHPKELDLRLSRLGKECGEEIKLITFQSKEQTKSLFFRLLVLLRFKLIVIVKYPIGLNANFERLHTDFRSPNSSKPNELVLYHEVNVEGRRNVSITIIKEINCSLNGKGNVDIDLYISPINSIIRWFCVNIIGPRCSINIDIIP
jgi:hypothetical protein